MHNDPRKVEPLLEHGARHDLISAIKWDDADAVRLILDERTNAIDDFGPRGEKPLDLAKSVAVRRLISDRLTRDSP